MNVLEKGSKLTICYSKWGGGWMLSVTWMSAPGYCGLFSAPGPPIYPTETEKVTTSK